MRIAVCEERDLSLLHVVRSNQGAYAQDCFFRSDTVWHTVRRTRARRATARNTHLGRHAWGSLRQPCHASFGQMARSRAPLRATKRSAPRCRREGRDSNYGTHSVVLLFYTYEYCRSTLFFLESLFFCSPQMSGERGGRESSTDQERTMPAQPQDCLPLHNAVVAFTSASALSDRCVPWARDASGCMRRRKSVVLKRSKSSK